MTDIYDSLLDQQEPSTTAMAPVAPAGQKDAYDTILDEFSAKQDAALKQSLDQAMRVLPQQAATTQQLAKASGLPEDLVERNKDLVQKQVKMRELQSLLASSPVLSRQMQDPAFAKLAQNDANTLSTIERLWRQPSGGAVEGLGMGTAGIGDTLSILQRNFMQGFANTFLPTPIGGFDKVDKASLAGPLVGQDWQTVGNYLKAQGRDIQIPQLQQQFFDKVLAGIGQVGAQIVVGAATGGGGSAAFLYGQGVNSMTEKTANDPGSQGSKDLAALLGGGVTAVTEKWALDKLLGPMAVPIQNQLGAALARVGIAGTSEGAQETIESIAQDSLRKFLVNPDAPIQIGQAFEEGGVGFTVGALVRSVVEAATGVRNRAARDNQQAMQAEQNTAMIEQLNKLAAASELLQTSPEAFQQFIEQAAADGDVTDLYIDAAVLMQSGVVDELAALSPAIAEQLPTAMATGGTVRIPVGEYAAKIAPSEFAPGLLDHLKTDPMGFTRTEAQEYFQNFQAQMEEEIAQQLAAKTGDQDFMDSKERVKQTVLTELNDLGRFTPQKNELDATLIAARTAVRAAQLGMTPEAFFEKQRLSFAAENVAGDQFSQVVDVKEIRPDSFANTSKKKITDKNGNKVPVPQVYYRGERQDGDKSVSGKDTWDKVLFASSSRGDAEMYAGSDGQVNELTPKPWARILYEGSKEFKELNKGNTWGGSSGRNLLEWANESADRAKLAGYDAVWFTRQADVGTAILNRDAFSGVDKLINQDAGTFDPNDPNILNQSQISEFDAVEKWVGLTKQFASRQADIATEAKQGEIRFYDEPADDGTFKNAVYFDKNGNVIGTLFAGEFTDDNKPGEWTGSVEVKYSERRKGIATELYDAMENTFAVKMKPAAKNSTDAAAFWRARNSQFKATSTEANEQALIDLLEPVGKSKLVGQEKGKQKADGVSRFDNQYGSTRYVFAEGGEIVSVLQVMRMDGGKAKIANVYTKPSARRKGYAAKLMTQARKDFKEVTHSDDLSNDGAAWANAVENNQQYLQSNPVVDPERNLYVAHNIRAEGILAANDLGGLAAPSIAVARADIGFDNFGEVTLIADPSLLTSGKVRTFDADIYSPRQPRAEYDVNEKKWYAFTEQLDPARLGLSKPDIQSAERDGPRALAETDAMRYAFLQEQGKLPKLKPKQVEPSVKKAAKLTGSKWDLMQDPKFIAIADDYYKEQVRKVEASDPSRKERYSSFWFNDDGSLQRNALENLAGQVVRYRDAGGKDIDQLRADINAKLRDGKLASEYQQWAEAQFNAMVDGKQIFKGFTNSGNRKYLPYTLENVVKEMTQTLQAGEGSFYGAGTVRSSVANEMKNIAQVQARRNQIVSEADLEKVKAESAKKLEEALEALKPFYKYDADRWGYDNDAGAAIAEGPKGQREAFKITPQSQKIIDDLLKYLSELPTAYFEAKAQRAVQFSEFNTAVVPKGMRKDALQVLKDAGLKIKTYDPQTEGDRARVVAEQNKLLFQDKMAPRGSYNPNTNTIALMKGADLSTFLHEAGHYFFESDINLATEIVQGNALFGAESMTQGESEILNDVSTLFTWFGFEGDIAAQLAQWNALSFEQKRGYHEKTAESFERYLFEGKAPSIELQSYFQQFRAWLVNVYKSIKDFVTNNPAAGELTDEVRAVFDRMLATNEEIQLAEQARSMMPLFRTKQDADNIGMTPDEFKAYQKQDVDATNEAIQDMQARAVRDLQWTRNAHNREVKRLQRQAGELRAAAKDEARAQVLDEPLYKAWQFLTRKLEESDKVVPVQRPKTDPNVVEPMVDSMFTAIAKLGGLNKQEAMETWGVEEAERPNSGVFGKPVLRVNGGKSIDGMVEALAQYGYLPLDENGKADIADFETKFDDELRGDPQYSVAYDYSIDDAMALRPGEQMDITALTAGRLDIGALMGMDLTSAEIELLKARRMTAKDGLHPDLVAELPGVEMSSGDELVRKLLAATPLKEEIEARAETIMLERHGELASPEAIAREADKAIHSEARAKMVATEANALARATGERKILAKAAKALAETMVARVKVRDIKPTQYASAEARAAKNAVKASNAGDLRTAAAEKRSQLVNTYATRAAYNAQDEINAALRYLKKFEKEGSRKGLDIEYLDQIDVLLERFDLRKGVSLKALDKRESLAKWIAAQEEQGFEPDLPEYVTAEANRVHYKNLTVEEFRGLVESVKQIEHLGRLKKKLLTAKDQRDLDAIVDEIKLRIEESSGGRTVNNEVRNTFEDKIRASLGKFLAAHRKAASVARELDGFEDGGPMWEYFTRSMNEAGDYEVTKRAETAKALHELAKPILAGEDMGGKGRFFPSLNRSVNRGEKIAMALNWGNDSNRQRLLGGKGWTAAQVQPVLDTMTAAEWQFVQGVWDLFESFRPEIAAKERRVSGKEPEWIEAVPLDITTADGQKLQLRGGYYPVKFDPLQSGKVGEHAAAEEAKQLLRAAYTAATTRRSFTKSRAAEVYDRPLLLSFDGIYQGMNEVIHDLAWHEWLIDANKLLRKLDGPIRTRFGANYVDVLKKAKDDIARGDTPAANEFEKALSHVRNGSTIVGMGWNITTALMQPLGFTQSAVRIGGKWIGRGMSEFFGSPSHMIAKAEEVQAKSKLMANRALTLNREINDVRNRLETSKSDTYQKVESTFFIMIQKMQAMVDYPTWLGAYDKALADPNNDEARAIALADQAVLDAQGGGQTKDLALVQRGSPLLKLFTNFYSYFNVLYNLTTERTKQRVKAKEYGGLLTDYTLLMIVPAVMSAIIRNATKGEDDEDEYMKAIAGELVGYPFGMFLGVREMAEAIKLAVGLGNPGLGYSGPAGLRFFNEVYKLGQQAGQGELDWAFFKAANNTAGILFHYPAGQINRLVEGVVALMDDKTDNPLAPLVGVKK